jgi:hypothetical protein
MVRALCIGALLTGCAGQTTDPRQGGLFSYNPDAYEQRLRDRRDQLTQVEQANQSEEARTSGLRAEQSAQLEEKAALERQLKKLSSSIASLEKDVKKKRAATATQQKERQRILHELQTLQSSARTADDMEDPEEKRLELERLKAKRDQLEKEASNLMKL